MFPNAFNHQLIDTKKRQAGDQKDSDESRDRIRDLYQRLCKELGVTQKDLGIVPQSKGKSRYMMRYMIVA